ncbi:hypothetical protein IWQ61_000008 [Dispira simplex]|nr:hypothetical protein IWQ61_000008 [Dispira simplex]
MHALYHWFISKNRLVHFDVTITLHNLVNVPLVSGTFFAKWRIKNGTTSSGYTRRAPISDHRVDLGYQISKKLDLVIGKDGVLSNCELYLQVKQETNQDSPRTLGVLTLNLAEYAQEGEVTRRYLLQESKSNSTFKITVHMKQTGGDTKYTTPTLKKNALLQFDDITKHPNGLKLQHRKRSMYDGPASAQRRPYSFSKSVSSPFLVSE